MKKTFSSFLIILVLWPVLAQAQLTFPTSLTNELDNTPIDDSARNIVVIIHGWTAKDKDSIPSNYNRYEDDCDAPALSYLFNILKLKLLNSDTKLITYHWEKDASTGIVEWVYHLPISLALGNATQAAINAKSHGENLGELLVYYSPNLRFVHFIAHSAGAWCAREAAKTLMENNPYVIVQITLLDPFIPEDVAPSRGLFAQAAMEEPTVYLQK